MLFDRFDVNRKRKIERFSVFLILSLCLVSCSENEVCKKADVVLVNTTIYTVNELKPKAEALAFLGDTLVFVGSNELSKEYQCGEAKVIDLEGSFVYPGFVDSHAHLKGYKGEFLKSSRNK